MRFVQALALALLGGYCAAGPVLAEPAKPLAPETLLVALVRDEEIEAEFGSTDLWWPQPPEFMGTLDPAPGLKTLVLQTFRRIEDNNTDRLIGALSLYESETAAAAAFRDLAPSDSRAYGSSTTGPALGHASRYYQRREPMGSCLRIQLGPFILRLSHWTDARVLSPAALARLAAPMIKRVETLWAGRLASPPLPAETALLPKDGGPYGPILGTAVGPPEWGSFSRVEGIDVATPMLRDFLVQQLDPPKLLLRRYALRQAPGQVLDVTIYPFSDTGSAQAFLTLDRDTRSAERVVLHPIPGLLSFLERPSGEVGQRIDLEFAKGRYVVEVSCGNPYGYLTDVCDRAVLDMAGRILTRIKR